VGEEARKQETLQAWQNRDRCTPLPRFWHTCLVKSWELSMYTTLERLLKKLNMVWN